MTDAQLKDMALQIGRMLARDAIWDDRRCNWLGPANDIFWGTTMAGYGMLGPSVYDGTAGIALFLAHLGKLTDDTVVQQTALGAINHAVSRYRDCPASVSLSFYTGHVGIGYAAILIGRLTGAPSLISQGKEILLGALHADTAGRCILDVMLGVAASIPAIIAVQDVLGRDRIEKPLLVWGGKILGHAVEGKGGLSWDTTAEMRTNAGEAAWLQPDAPVPPNLLGYGHGASGIGLALLALGTAFDQDQLRVAGKRAFAYEEAWFDPIRGCWPDLRYHGQAEAKGRTEVAWCHGATGIGLARLRAHALTGDPALLEQARTAAELTKKTLLTRLTPQTNLCLCHGVGSDIEVLLHPEAVEPAESDIVLNAVHEFIQKSYLDTGRPLAYGGGDKHQPPGLMLGLAGTGYALLRCMKVDRPPSLVCVGAV